MTLEELEQLVINTLENMKAQDIKVIDVSSKSSVTERMIIATGTSTRHVKSIADDVVKEAKDAGMPPLGSEGEEAADWVLVDLNDIVLHVMLAETRGFYNLEKLWETEDMKSPEQQAEDDAAEEALSAQALQQAKES
jgi:ribosome-associated protein